MARADLSLLAVAAMAAVTYATRFLGIAISAFGELPAPVRRFLDRLASATLAALLALTLLAGDLALYAGAAVAFAFLLILKRPLLAMAAAALSAAAARYLSPGG